MGLKSPDESVVTSLYRCYGSDRQTVRSWILSGITGNFRKACSHCARIWMVNATCKSLIVEVEQPMFKIYRIGPTHERMPKRNPPTRIPKRVMLDATIPCHGHVNAELSAPKRLRCGFHASIAAFLIGSVDDFQVNLVVSSLEKMRGEPKRRLDIGVRPPHTRLLRERNSTLQHPCHMLLGFGERLYRRNINQGIGHTWLLPIIEDSASLVEKPRSCVDVGILLCRRKYVFDAI